MAARLKVFATRIGFHDVVVAAPSQKAALAAWDVKENLFAQGAASTTDEPAALEAALASPGEVLSRPIGGGAFTVERAAPAQAPKVDRPKGKKAAAAAAPAARRPPPDRSALTAAERALAELEAESRRALDALAQERKALDAREAGLRRDFDTRRRKLERERDRARRVYEQSGG